MVRFLMWLTARLPIRIIEHDGEPFLERYTLGRLPGLQLYIHRFIASDPDGLHDHPWRFGLSVILAGSYLEENRYGVRRVSWVNYVPGTWFHRVLIGSGQQCWSLFIHTARVKDWGFMRFGWYGNSYDIVANSGRAFSRRSKALPRGRDVARAP